MIPEQTSENSLRLYNALYNNTLYRQIGDLVAADLNTNRDSIRVASIMNMLTDTALMLCGHPNYNHAWIALAIVCANEPLSENTITSMSDYLRIFQQYLQDPRREDFAACARSLIQAYRTIDDLRPAAAAASEVHTWQARAAYHLLTAAEYITVAALNLLKQEDDGYISEKLTSGLTRLGSAIHEMTWASSRMREMDFSLPVPSNNQKQPG